MLNTETWDFIRQHIEADVHRLALKPPSNKAIDFRMALQQIEGHRLAIKKLPSWAGKERIIFPPRLSMEQCSSEPTALYKQTLCRRILQDEGFESPCLTDLTGGFGIDFSFMAPLFARAIYMERQPELCRLAKYNFAQLNLHQAEVYEGDSVSIFSQLPDTDFCFIDPARRDKSGHKTVAINNCEPDLTLLQEIIRKKTRFCLIKLSPMLDISQALHTLSHIREVHVISVRGECKELLLLMTREQPENLTFHCINLSETTSVFSFSPNEELNTVCSYTDNLGQYLYEPNASILKCSAYKIPASRYQLQKLHPHSHLYTSDICHKDFPGRVFQIDECCNFNKKELKVFLSQMSQANLSIRNFPSDVDSLRKRLRLKDGGSVYLFATTLANQQHVLIKCHKL